MTALSGDEAGLLQALAQIAVAFAGFAGVIGAFSRFSTDRRVTAFRIRGMVGLALFALIMALAPFAAAAFGDDAPSVWRISTGLSAALGAPLIGLMASRVIPLLRERLLHTGALNILWYGLAAAMVLSAAAAALAPGLGLDAARVHIVGVILVLVLCAYNFLMLVLSIRFDGQP